MYAALLGPYEMHSFVFCIHWDKENLLIASILIRLSHWGIQRDGFPATGESWAVTLTLMSKPGGCSDCGAEQL